MNSVHGITLTESGTFVMATVLNKPGSSRMIKSREWSSFSHFRNFLLLHRMVHFAHPTHWSRKAPLDDQALITRQIENGFYLSANREALSQSSELISDNIASIVPDQMLLLTLPRKFVKDLPSSFCSVYQKDGVITIGIIILGKLSAVFSASGITSPEEFNGLLGRIKRYWKEFIEDDQNPFPDDPLYLLNDLPFTIEESPVIKRIDCESDDPFVLAAAGAALCEKRDLTYALTDVPEKGTVPALRSFFFFASILLLSLTLIASGSLFLYNNYILGKLKSVKSSYNNILYNNQGIRDLVSQGDLLASDVLRHNALVSHPTNWAPFLEFIGKNRPEKLHLIRLGSEPIRNDSSHIRVAISGWSGSETLVTEFIKTLSSSEMIDNISLSSIARIPKKDNSCTFKILCRLTLLKK